MREQTTQRMSQELDSTGQSSTEGPHTVEIFLEWQEIYGYCMNASQKKRNLVRCQRE